MPISKMTVAVITVVIASSTAFADDRNTKGMHEGHSASSMTGGAMHSSPNAAQAPVELQFLDTMTVHHQSGIKMLQLVESRSAHDELKAMAKKSIDDQEKDIRQMQGWKDSWYSGKPDAVNMQMPGMESMRNMDEHMKRLSAAKGKQFDSMFLDMMIKHHQGAVKMAKEAQGKFEHADLKQFAKTLIDKQNDEIAQMEKWKKDWKLAGK